MSLRLVAWNIEEQLGIPERSEQIVESVKRLDADVLVLPDAYWLGNPLHGASEDVVLSAIDNFQDEGYVCRTVGYGDPAGQWRDRFMLMLSRMEIDMPTNGADSAELPRTADLRVRCADNSAWLRVIGVHFDDLSEDARLNQAKNVVGLKEHFSEPLALAGDLNAMHENGVRSRLLRSRVARTVAKALGNPEPRNDYEREHGRKNKLERLTEMAGGQTIRMLVEAGLHDADDKLRPTMPAKRPMVQLDHIMVNELVDVHDFKVHEPGGSDHRAISARLDF